LRSKRLQFLRVRDLHRTCTASGLLTTPLEAAPWRRYSSNPPSKTPTSGLGTELVGNGCHILQALGALESTHKTPLCTRPFVARSTWTE
jgi:hypothetical protein